MGLFGSKKKEEKLPPLEFPELPKSIPTFDSNKNMPEASPARPAMSAPTMPSARPVSSRPAMPTTPSNEQPLFIKVEKYQSVMDNLKKLKAKLSEADDSLAKLTKLRDEEGRELSAWHSDLEKVKGQLMEIDKKLFE
tara:strand:- start:303 stop:713 length:411 start_codon:yes stop_codon:yes gene_type:complete